MGNAIDARERQFRQAPRLAGGPRQVLAFSHLDDFALLLDGVELIQFSVAAAGADFTSGLPIGFGAKVGIPKRPSPALPWPGRVNLASASLVVEEHAIETIREFPQAFANADLANEVLLEVLDAFPNQRCQLLNFLGIYPHETRAPRTAIAATGTLEFQTFGIPGLLIIH